MRILKSIMITLNALLVGGVFLLNYYYQSTGFPLALKMACSILFASIGGVNLLYALLSKAKPLPFYLGMAISLLLSCLADYFISLDLVTGAIVFAVGHLGFLFSYSTLQKLKLLDLLVGGGIFLLCLTFLLACLSLAVPHPIVCIVGGVYALIISMMLGKAIGNAIREKSAVTIVIAVGSFLFLFSDVMLAWGWFSPANWTHRVCMATYYPALCLLALSMLFKALSHEKTPKNAR